MQSKKFCFVILHYMDSKTTVECVESILSTLESNTYEIVIVDNASPNNSGKELRDKYANLDNIHVIIADKNGGFARGNNIGYSYAKNKLDADYVICINNDTLIEQREFLEKIKFVTEKTKCDVLGPAIVSTNGDDQNPRRKRRLTMKEIRQHLLRKKIMLGYFYWKKYLFELNMVEKLYGKSSEEYKSNICAGETIEDPVLLGACIIYCPGFVKNEKYAFSPKTFMYGEEDLLAWYCYRKSYKVIYSPEISIIHLGEVSTKMSTKSEVDKMIFLYKYMIEGLQLLKEEMKQPGR